MACLVVEPARPGVDLAFVVGILVGTREVRDPEPFLRKACFLTGPTVLPLLLAPLALLRPIVLALSGRNAARVSFPLEAPPGFLQHTRSSYGRSVLAFHHDCLGMLQNGRSKRLRVNGYVYGPTL